MDDPLGIRYPSLDELFDAKPLQPEEVASQFVSDSEETIDDQATEPDAATIPHPRVPHTQEAIYVDFNWLNKEMTTVSSTVYCEKLEPLGSRFEVPIVLVHGDYHTGSVRYEYRNDILARNR